MGATVTPKPAPTEAVEAPIVSLRDASKSYGPIKALNGVTLELRAGEVMCLAGENGAGKSTLIKILTGAIRRDEGAYLIDGQEVGNPSPAEVRAAGIGVVYQELSLLPDLSVAENLLMGHLPAVRGITRPIELRRQARAMLERVGLDWLDPGTEVATLSLAVRQLVEIAKVLGADPRVLIFDEPTTALSESETKALLARIHGLRDEGHAIMYVSHHLEEMFEIGDRVTILRDGGLVTLQADGRARPRQPHRVDGRAQDRVAVPGGQPHDRRAAAARAGAATGGRGRADRLPGPRRRDRRHRGAARLRAQRAAAGDLRGRPGRGRPHRGRRREGAPRRSAPGGAGGHGPADRGPQAARAAARALDPRERLAGAPRRDLALLDRRQAPRARHRRPVPRRPAPARGELGAAGVVAVGRQPAEGAPGPLAGDQGEGAHVRRADQGRRRRGQGRDLQGHRRPRRRRARRGRGVVLPARGARARRPRARHARGHDRGRAARGGGDSEEQRAAPGASTSGDATARRRETRRRSGAQASGTGGRASDRFTTDRPTHDGNDATA